MGRLILGIVVGILFVIGAVFFYFTTGMAPAAAAARPMPFERYFTHAILHAKLDREAPKTAPLEATAENLQGGAMVYKQNCAFCHGLPNAKPSPEGSSMYPHAPQLFMPDEMVTDDPPGVTYWKVKNGMRMSGMPSFGRKLNEQQMWQVSLLLSNADKLPPKVGASLLPSPEPVPAAQPPAQPATPARAPQRR